MKSYFRIAIAGACTVLLGLAAYLFVRNGVPTRDVQTSPVEVRQEQPSGEDGSVSAMLGDKVASTDRIVIAPEVTDAEFTNKDMIVGGGAHFWYKIKAHGGGGWLAVYRLSDVSRMVFIDAKEKMGYGIGDLAQVSYTGNSSGLWLPVALTKDDAKVVMCAVMGDPGAGGSSVDYGCHLLAFKPVEDGFVLWKNKDELLDTVVNARYLYDQDGKDIYLAQGTLTPHHAQPGPRTDSVIMYRDLVSGVAKKLVEDADTTYRIVSLDEIGKVLTYDATLFRYPAGCVRGDGGLRDEALDCAETVTTTRKTVALP